MRTQDLQRHPELIKENIIPFVRICDDYRCTLPLECGGSNLVCLRHPHGIDYINNFKSSRSLVTRWDPR
jgi:hypothetical protein